MNLEELRRIREQERSTDSLQDLRPDFYKEVADYLDALRRERNELARSATDPFTDPEVQRMTDELQAAERTVEALYERRVGKIVKLASFAAADMAVEVEGVTTEEEQLFESIVEEIQAFGDEITSRIDAGSEPVLETGYREDPQKSDPTPAPERDSHEDSEIRTERTTVRITDDVGPIVGVDERNYDLATDDIVTLPNENATPLLEGDVAEKIE